ncbi:hypothetical protein L873DRAFT_1810091 [Choiromyces venosus 120613-1]|uniref:Secreted protein n=1 Tax=Choiromyces venosus 120613-1 TaxID=1336337 RepID=A0A3N4JU93_9PEZI|nr:hypothetical protein L873DRAFT_1810091 [Choiromyces venosus 120613-1]
MIRDPTICAAAVRLETLLLAAISIANCSWTRAGVGISEVGGVRQVFSLLRHYDDHIFTQLQRQAKLRQASLSPHMVYSMWVSNSNSAARVKKKKRKKTTTNNPIVTITVRQKKKNQHLNLLLGTPENPQWRKYGKPALGRYWYQTVGSQENGKIK